MKLRINAKPLSVNRCWQGRRFKTPIYKAYEEELFYLIPKPKKIIKGLVEVYYKFYIKNFKMADVDNFIKPFTDIIVKKGLIEDDRFIVKMCIEKFKCEKEHIEIEINEV